MLIIHTSGGGSVPWPQQLPDLSCVDFFLWGHLKSIICDTLVDSYVDLVPRLAVAARDVQDRLVFLLMYTVPYGSDATFSNICCDTLL